MLCEEPNINIPCRRGTTGSTGNLSSVGTRKARSRNAVNHQQGQSEAVNLEQGGNWHDTQTAGTGTRQTPGPEPAAEIEIERQARRWPYTRRVGQLKTANPIATRGQLVLGS